MTYKKGLPTSRDWGIEDPDDPAPPPKPEPMGGRAGKNQPPAYSPFHAPPNLFRTTPLANILQRRKTEW